MINIINEIISMLNNESQKEKYKFLIISLNNNIEYFLQEINYEPAKIQHVIFREDSIDELKEKQKTLTQNPEKSIIEGVNKYYNIKTIIIPSYDVMPNILSNLMKLFYIDNIYISGAISNFDQLSEKTVQEFTSTLSKKLIANNYKIYSGYGRGVGSALLKGVIDHVSLDL